MARWRAPRRLYVNARQNRVVPEDSPEAAFLLVGEGGYIDRAVAERLGLLDDEPDPKSTAQAPETKAVHQPPEDKGMSGPRARER